MLVLPKELLDIIGQYNVMHRPLFQKVMHELLVVWDQRNIKFQQCANCDGPSDDQDTCFILWRKYSFCDEGCYYAFAYHLRKAWRRRNTRL